MSDTKLCGIAMLAIVASVPANAQSADPINTERPSFSFSPFVSFSAMTSLHFPMQTLLKIQVETLWELPWQRAGWQCDGVAAHCNATLYWLIKGGRPRLGFS